MDIQKEREAFESYLKKMGKTDNETFSKNEDDSYQMDIIHFGWKIWQAAKAQAVPEKTVKLHLVWNENKDECVGFLDSKDAHYTATGDDRGMFGVTALGDYFRDLNDERNEFETQIVMIEAQEPSNNATPELVNNAVTYVIELQGYEAIEYARVTLNKKGYKTWDYTDKDSIDDTDIYVLCVCPSTPNDSALVKGAFKGIHQGKFTYIQSDLESCPDAQEPAND